MSANSTLIFKSLRNVVYEAVDRFAYEDFRPSQDKDDRRRRFEEVLTVETAYWKASSMPANWRANWFSIETKTDERILYIAFSIQTRALKAVLHSGIEGSNFLNVIEESSVDIGNVWIDHSIMYDWLLGLLEKSIKAGLKRF